MRIAWFRPSEPGPHGEIDHLAAVVDGLRRAHAITPVDEDGAHDFVWQQARGAFDLCVYELDNTPRHQYMWPYLLNYSGVLALQSATLHDARRARLVHEGRMDDYRAEIAFAGGPSQVKPPWHLARGQWPMLRIPVTASRLTAVADEALAKDLADLVPAAAVRTVTVGIADPLTEGAAAPGARSSPLLVAAAEPARRAVVERAAARASDGTIPITVVDERDLAAADVVVAVRWPLHGRPLMSALRAVAAGKPTVVAETYATAGWPSLDPQTWRARDGNPDAPAVVSLDPRDEEHSLVLALRRLAADANLRADLGRAARAWWTTHATLAHALADWTRLLADAGGSPAPPRPEGWPLHLDDDGLGLTRRILAASGLALVPGY